MSEKSIVIELYELWNNIKSRFNIVSAQPKSFTLDTKVIPTLSLDHSKFSILDLTDATSVAAAATDVQTVQPPKGYYYTIRGIYLNIPVPAGGAAGTHIILVRHTGLGGYAALVKSAFGAVISIIGFGLFNGNAEEGPTGDSEQYDIMHNSLIATHDVPVTFSYTNNTDVSQTGTRTLHILVEEKIERA